MKRGEIKILLKHKSNFFFLARITKSGNAFRVLGTEDDKELRHLYGNNKELLRRVKNKGFFKPYYLGDSLFEICPWGLDEIKTLDKYKKIRKNDNLIIIDNSILKAKTNDDICFDILTADYRRGDSIDFKYIKHYPIIHLINMSGYFLIIAFRKPGAKKRLLKSLHLK